MAAKRSRTTSRAEKLARSVAAAFTALREAQRDEHFYFFALQTTEDGDSVCATAWSEEALSRAAAAWNKKDARRTVAGCARELRFSAESSPYHDVSSDMFAEFAPGPALHEACFAALAQLDREGFFGSGQARENVILNVVYGDMSDERWLAHAQRLNPRAIIDAVLPFLRLHLPIGNVSRWGQGAYQVNALSLSSDRSIVAYCGSGGHIGVLRVADHQAIHEKRRKGEHWACALSPDGSRVFLGDADGVGVLQVSTGQYKPILKTGKPASLALSPDGDLLAISTWTQPLSIIETASGRQLWQQPGVNKVSLAFSPCGRWLAAAGSRRSGDAWIASVTCSEASTGRERWSAPLGNGLTNSIAWTPDGQGLFGASFDPTALTHGDSLHSGSLVLFSSAKGTRLQTIPWRGPIDFLAVAPGGQRLALCSKESIVFIDRDGRELARGTGGQESLTACAFVDDHTVLAVGRDVNDGPAILMLSV